MAKKVSDPHRLPTKVYSIAQPFEIPRNRKTTSHTSRSRVKDAIAIDDDSRCGNKRRRVLETEDSSGLHRMKVSSMRETHYSIAKRVAESGAVAAAKGNKSLNAAMAEAQIEKKQSSEIDRFKKMQCSAELKRLMVHRDVWPFKKPEKDLGVQHVSDVTSKPLMDFETIKFKLEKGLYMKTDQFAGDIRILFSNAMLHHPKWHEIHKIATRLLDLFEMKWKFLEEMWEAEKAKEEEEKRKPKPNLGKKRKSVSELSTDEKAMPKQCRLDTILASMDSLFGCKNAELQRRPKEREDARMALEKMERTVRIEIEDNLKYCEELQRLCGFSLNECKRVNPLEKILGLTLKKDEFMADLEDEDKFLSTDWDWEEGEIIRLD